MKSSHIIFIHGLSNKPRKSELQRLWLEALATPHKQDGGFNLGAVGIQASFIYWADLFYDTPLPDGDYESNFESKAAEIEASITSNIQLIENDWSSNLAKKYSSDLDFSEPPNPETDDPYELIPIPKPIKNLFIKKFARESYAYLFNVDQIRDKIKSRFFDVLNKRSFDNTVLVGHSQGSFIAYDILTSDTCPEIHGFMTIGSPLGVDEIQRELDWSRQNGFPKNLSGDWVNVYDFYDPISILDPKLANDFLDLGKKRVIDVNEQNWGKWRHSATKYLKGPKLRNHLRRLSLRP